ncbi:hypothetical protein DPMN_017870 [Dreissena polymorpha]|uniref:Uncharacterized protein n=1 Tax=Dreissena polymorpha TaxID=45954 RepID=A0A9D4NE48_DREPO|nr:hypothetical protein DPMN_017870 [Dreissena polymorpha]
MNYRGSRVRFPALLLQLPTEDRGFDSRPYYLWLAQLDPGFDSRPYYLWLAMLDRRFDSRPYYLWLAQLDRGFDSRPYYYGDHVFKQTATIFEISSDINRTHVLTKKNYPPPLRLCFSIGLNHFRAQLRYYLLTKVRRYWTKRFYYNSNVKKSAPPPGGLLTRLYNSHVWKTPPSPGGHFHKGSTMNVTSRVLRIFYCIHKGKNPCP